MKKIEIRYDKKDDRHALEVECDNCTDKDTLVILLDALIYQFMEMDIDLKTSLQIFAESYKAIKVINKEDE